ncbi:hypothetical protein D3273_27650 [Lichenibacterium minor]|uniref:Uncharacterized protein n=1 Tax=Lichenibacterium minor TaxID=2316528 RepID=A0A4Q2TXF6_9HYPH|nr:hypothetical protein [Lichenibacterium minor]RYC28753.1 hypothetical protein D3273_27650 [Lichenibacterium minor]
MSRRDFLRGLVSLPLIGGGLTLTGNPTAAAVPVTPVLQDRYIAWLANEHAAALFERDMPGSVANEEHLRLCTDWHFARARVPLWWFPEAPDIERVTAYSKPSKRAAVILSAAGVPLTGGAHG